MRVRGELRGHNRGRILREGLGLGLRWLRTRVGRQSSFRFRALGFGFRGTPLERHPPTEILVVGGLICTRLGTAFIAYYLTTRVPTHGAL